MAADPSESPTFTVGELNRLIRQTLARRFPDEVWVEGEIRGLKRHQSSGHVYFELADPSADGRQADAVIQVALYRLEKEAVNRLLRRNGSVRMADGVHIRIRGTLDYYPPQGRLQLRMQWIDPDHTLGRLEAERQRLIEALRVEGLLDRNRSLPFPTLPLRVGLVTSEGSAAHHDFVHELEASGFAWKVALAPAAVQGPGADTELVAALRSLAAARVDVIAVVRGGGARTDLAAFDHEAVVRTIAELGVPVHTGIGHETDRSVADLVAARAAKTPTACAAGLVADVAAARDRARRAWDAIAGRAVLQLDRRDARLDQVAARVAAGGRRELDREADRVRGLAPRLARAAVDHPERAAARVRGLGGGIATGAGHELDRASGRLAVAGAQVTAADPARLLERGWAVLRRADGSLVSGVGDVQVGDELVATVVGGTVRSNVVGVEHDPNAPPPDPTMETGADGAGRTR